MLNFLFIISLRVKNFLETGGYVSGACVVVISLPLMSTQKLKSG